MSFSRQDNDNQTETDDDNDFIKFGDQPNRSLSSMPALDSIVDARPILPIVSFFMGDLRDGLAMVSLLFFDLYCISN